MRMVMASPLASRHSGYAVIVPDDADDMRVSGWSDEQVHGGSSRTGRTGDTLETIFALQPGRASGRGRAGGTATRAASIDHFDHLLQDDRDQVAIIAR